MSPGSPPPPPHPPHPPHPPLAALALRASAPATEAFPFHKISLEPTHARLPCNVLAITLLICACCSLSHAMSYTRCFSTPPLSVCVSPPCSLSSVSVLCEIERQCCECLAHSHGWTCASGNTPHHTQCGVSPRWCAVCGRPLWLALPHYTIPSPTTRAHPAGMPGLETAGRGQGGAV